MLIRSGACRQGPGQGRGREERLYEGKVEQSGWGGGSGLQPRTGASVPQESRLSVVSLARGVTGAE